MSKPLALAYVRVSTVDQVENGASLDAQECALRAEADRRGWDVEIVREEGKSAKSMNRPALQGALKRLDRGEAQFFLAVRLDRVSRSVADFAAMIDRARRRGWGLVLQSPNIDLSDPAGEFTANVLASAAQYERRLISVRTREGMVQKRAEAERDGRKFRCGREVSAEFIPTYSRVLAMHDAGMSFNSIAKALDAEGVPTARGGKWAAATVRRMVLSEFAKTLTLAA